ncbi:disintegrin and metalloproteinase domain-containing protein 19 [Arapaima gigas]
MGPLDFAHSSNLMSAQHYFCLGLCWFCLCLRGAEWSEAARPGEGSQAHGTQTLDYIKDYDITHPLWQHQARHKRSPGHLKHLAEAEVKITAEGKELVLQLQKNEELFALKYKETWYSPSGVEHTSSPPSTENCFYHGLVVGEEMSSVAVSNCSGLRGMVTLNSSVTYLIEPLPSWMGNVEGSHAVYRAELLKLQKGMCGHHHGNDTDQLGNLISGMMQPYVASREKRDISQNMKYVELMVVADYAEFEKNDRDYEKTRMKLLEAVNFVDKYYKSLNIRVALIGLEVWTDKDKITVSQNPYSTLGAFLVWRSKRLAFTPNDNAQLVTGVSFQGTTIGLAPLKAMCSEYQSGGINSDHSDNAVGVAATMAHEMGHNFGMSHDTPGCCLARPEDGGCIMAAATGHPFPRVFNTCNRKELQRYLSSGGGKCLFNLPNTNTMYGGHRCGNGYLEEGEECDCGEADECFSPCCNANNCTLKPGAECAHGICCDNCKLKSPGVLCRPVSGSCDLPEFCDGKSEFCPANFYLMDGTLCDSGQAYCYTGMCLTLEQQCLSLWGQGAHPAPDLCFKKVNEAGDPFGNCGKDQMGKYRSCQDKDAKCGKIQCLSTAAKPLETNAVSIDTTIRQGDRKILCKGTHVYRSDQGSDTQGDTLDPGLVMTGTKCGENGICFDGQCRNASFLQADTCSAKCHGHGLCNNNHNCHCEGGWAPPSCEHQGMGGSIDSGPVTGSSSLLLILVLVPLLLFLGIAAAILWFCYKIRFGPQKSTGQPPIPCKLQFTNNVGRAGHHGHTNPTFQPKKQDCDIEVGPQQSPACPSRARHSIVRPTIKPPPIPAYIAQHQSTHKELSSPPPANQSPPTVPVKPRPNPPSRPPPLCPLAKPSQVVQHKGTSQKTRIHCDILGRGCKGDGHAPWSEETPSERELY